MCEQIVTFFLRSGTSLSCYSRFSFFYPINIHPLLGVTPDQIGIITPYEGQRVFIVNHMRRAGALRAELYDQVR